MKPFAPIENAWLRDGGFAVGCNYWASHAGTRMWVDWQPSVVRQDLERLRHGGLQVLRVFPLWPDFQPITLLRGGGEGEAEIRHGETPLPDDACGQAGLSTVLLERFAAFLDMLAAEGMGCIVGLLTGWMSGRLFVPPALEGRPVLTDPLSLRWQVRFVRHFVGRFKDHPAILAWDLGNECNCMERVTRHQAFAWTALIAQTIRVSDPSRPVISGMHGLSLDRSWRIEDQGELTDVLTTHPYPLFTAHCDQDPIHTIRPILHGTAESRLYADLGGKSCLCEEMGTLGPMLASEPVAAAFARCALFSLWANDCHGLLWWCASDQTHLEHAPYDWCTVERELGLLRVDGGSKPVLKEFGAFRNLLEHLPFDRLPPRSRDAVCILTEGQDAWGVAFSSFILAKQAGFEIEFQSASQPLKEAPFYLLPCLEGSRMIPRRRMKALLEKVEAGATLYLSINSGLLDGVEALTGLMPETRQRGRAPGDITLTGIPGLDAIPNHGAFKVVFRPTRATVYGTEPDGNPALTVAPYGKGRVIFLAVPMELTLAQTPGVFHQDAMPPCWRLYQWMAEQIPQRRAAWKTLASVGLTEHLLDDGRRVEVAINYSPGHLREQLTLAAGWKLDRVLAGTVVDHGQRVDVELAPNDACVLIVAPE